MRSSIFAGLPYPANRNSADVSRTTSPVKGSIPLRYLHVYTILRSVVPVPVLVYLSIRDSDTVGGQGIRFFLQHSITLRHLLAMCAVLMLWNIWCGTSTYVGETSGKELLSEILKLVTGSIACTVFFRLLDVPPMANSAFAYAGGSTALAMAAVSLLLLALILTTGTLSLGLRRPRPALIIGSGYRATLLRTRLKERHRDLAVYGCIDDEYLGTDREMDNYLGGIDQLEELLKYNPIEAVLIGLPFKSKYDQIHQVIRTCEAAGVESHCMQDIFEMSHARIQPHPNDPHQFAVWTTVERTPRRYLKRALDLVGASVLIIILTPVLIVVAVAVRLSSPGPLLFIQQRYGLNRKRFPLLKFRSMVANAEQLQASLETQNEVRGPAFKLRKDPRITRVGALLRRTSLDELPQLLNVLRGEMSLVGPRPLPLRDVFRFEENWLLRRFSVLPGLTCLWQVSGRSDLSFEEWIQKDLEYIDNWSLSLDLKILLRTVPAVVRGSGAV